MEVNWTLIIILIIVIVLVILIIIFITSSKYNNEDDNDIKQGKLIYYSGLFKQVSKLNIGHSNGAPIFHAHPWFGKGFGNGIGDYLGTIQLKRGKSLYLKFPHLERNPYYEVNVFAYPSWDHYGDTIYCSRNISIGPNSSNNIVVDNNQDFVVIVTGFSVLPDQEVIDVKKWLSMCKVYIDECPERNSNNSKERIQIPVNADENHFDQILEKYNSFISQYLKLNDRYRVKHDITSQQSNNMSFPPTHGVIESITYSPTSDDEILILVIPNRNLTLGVSSATYLEVAGERYYFSTGKDIADIYIYEIDKLDQIYIEERFLCSPLGNTLPFYAFIINKI